MPTIGLQAPDSRNHPDTHPQASAQAVPAPNVQSCRLAEALSQAPALLAAIPTQDWNALAACNRQLQQTIHTSVQAITVSDRSDTTAIVRHSWPQLALIDYSSKSFNTGFATLSCNNNIELIATIHFSTQTGLAMGFLVRPKGTQHQQSWHLDAAVLRLQRQQCPHASFLRLCSSFQPAQVLQHLNQGQWLGVKHLILSSSSIDATAIKHMRRAAWPQLKVLDLSCKSIDEDALTNLECMAWGSLESVKLDRNPLTASAIAQIPELFGQPGIQKLSLSRVQLSSAGAVSLAVMRCSLTDLVLSSTGISTSALSQLLSVPWPVLQQLDLSNNALAADAVAVLTSATLLKLTSLDISSNKLDAAAVEHLVGSKWPVLRRLTLHNNGLNNAAMAALARGDWPALQSIALRGNHITSQGVKALMVGWWPLLKELEFDFSTASPAILLLLSLEVKEAFDPLGPGKRLLTQRNVVGHHVWPLLVSVRFYSDVTSLSYQLDLRLVF